jgi:hypothetical protein
MAPNNGQTDMKVRRSWILLRNDSLSTNEFLESFSFFGMYIKKPYIHVYKIKDQKIGQTLYNQKKTNAYALTNSKLNCLKLIVEEENIYSIGYLNSLT